MLVFASHNEYYPAKWEGAVEMRLRVLPSSRPAMTVHRRILRRSKIVYVIAGKKSFKYTDGKSRIVYIGTTRKGADRIASSAANRAEEILVTRGFREMEIYVISCSSRPGLKTWIWLERALLAVFRSRYHQLPKCNSQGRKLRWNDKLHKMFSRARLERILASFE